MKKTINLTQAEFEQAIYEAVQAERERIFEENKEAEVYQPDIKKIGPFRIIKELEWLKFQESLKLCITDIVYSYHKINELEERIRIYEEQFAGESKRTVDELIMEAQVECAEANFNRVKDDFEKIYKRTYKKEEEITE